MSGCPDETRGLATWVSSAGEYRGKGGAALCGLAPGDGGKVLLKLKEGSGLVADGSKFPCNSMGGNAFCRIARDSCSLGLRALLITGLFRSAIF